MNLKNINIRTQLILGFGIVLLMVGVLGVVSYQQTDKIHEQTETIYSHPLQVRRAIGKLEADIFAIHRDLKDLFIAADEKDFSADLYRIDQWQANAVEQIDILYNQYLGPRSDIDSVKQALLVWKSIREETIRLLRTNQRAEAVSRTRHDGVGGHQAEELLAKVQIVDEFARKKGDALFTYSQDLNRSLHQQLVLLIVVIVLLSLLVNIIIMRSIRRPLAELTRAAREFQNGNFESRSTYTTRNEFGLLSDVFNELTESVQENLELSKKTAHLAGVMLSEDDTKKFFHAMMRSLAEHTGSQVAAAYLLDDAKKQYVHFESIGLGEHARQSFDAGCFEGEFGAVLATREIRHIREIPSDTRFAFHTTGGALIPREILTIPVLTGKEVVAVISLASLSAYTVQTRRFIDAVLNTLCARVEGVLAYRRLKELTAQLKSQNQELQAQQSELAAQSTELSEQNHELEMQAQQLDEASRLKTTFLSNMSHELRTPLNSVIALSGVLHRRLGGKLSGEEYGYIEVIERNGKLLLALINDILDIARIESGREETEITGFSVDSLVADIVGMIQPQARQKRVALNHHSSPAVITIESDSDKCRHILQNIIGNAIKFTEKGSVDVSAMAHDGTVQIVVTDTGIGIAPEHLAHIFDEFRQADGSTSRKYGGTGLGLAIARKYATLLGGGISVASTPGQGSVFTLTLPIRVSPGVPIEPSRAPLPVRTRPGAIADKPAGGNAGATILLVEDSEPAVVQIRDFLEGSGYRILVAANGEKALAMIDKNIPDAIILDLMMPGIDGFGVLKTVREAQRTAHLPVLILTAKHITKDELRFLTRNNIHQLIQKGDVNRGELLHAVDAMVGAHPAPSRTVPRRRARVIDGKPVVLVVEDNPDNMLTMRALLAQDYEMLEAADGHAGVELAHARKPHCILMDIGLPEKDGVEAFNAIRDNPDTAHIPVIAVTASAMTSDRETILAYGFDAYVAKPIDADKLFKCMSEVLFGT